MTARRVATLAIAASIALGISPAAQTRPSESSRNFLWKVQAATGVLYLAGSVHALSADVYPLNPPFQRAFDASATLVEEIDLTDADLLTAGPMLLSKGMFRDGRTFDTVVSKETLAQVAERLKPLPIEMLRPMKPWVVALMLSALEVQRAGLDPALGLDKHFFDKAKAAGKNVIGLETVESQIDLFDRMPDALQEQLLRSTLAELDTQQTSLKTIVSAWRRGDGASIEKVLLDGFKQNPGAYTSLIVQRNHNWMPQMEACLTRPSPCFVVVGAAHLVGPDGLLALLQQKGYRVEQQ